MLLYRPSLIVNASRRVTDIKNQPVEIREKESGVESDMPESKKAKYATMDEVPPIVKLPVSTRDRKVHVAECHRMERAAERRRRGSQQLGLAGRRQFRAGLWRLLSVSVLYAVTSEFGIW